MKAINRKELILSLLLATGCGGNTVDLGHGGGSEWFDVSDGGGKLMGPRTIFESASAYVLGIGASESDLFVLVSHEQSLELITCAASDCRSGRSVLYRSAMGHQRGLWLTPILAVGEHLFWIQGSKDGLGIATCPRTGCEQPGVVPVSFMGLDSSIVADDSHVYFMDADSSLLRLAPGDDAATVVRQDLEADVGVLTAVGDFVHFTSRDARAVHRVSKNGSAGAEVVARGEAITGIDVSGGDLYYASQVLDGSIVRCAIGEAACDAGPLLSKQRWPAGVRVVGKDLFWASGFVAGSSEPGGQRRPASLWSCELPACQVPRQRAEELFFARLAGDEGGSLQSSSFTYSSSAVFWLEEQSGARLIRRLPR